MTSEERSEKAKLQNVNTEPHPEELDGNIHYTTPENHKLTSALQQQKRLSTFLNPFLTIAHRTNS